MPTSVSEPRHGLYRFTALGCRCEDCRSAKRNYLRDWRLWRREHGAIVPGWRDLLHQGEGGTR